MVKRDKNPRLSVTTIREYRERARTAIYEVEDEVNMGHWFKMIFDLAEECLQLKKELTAARRRAKYWEGLTHVRYGGKRVD